MEHLEDDTDIITKIQGTRANDDKESIESLPSDIKAVRAKIEAVGIEIAAVKYCLANKNMDISDAAMKMVPIYVGLERRQLHEKENQLQEKENQLQVEKNQLQEKEILLLPPPGGQLESCAFCLFFGTVDRLVWKYVSQS